MPRKRNISPMFFANEQLAAMNPHCQLLFIGLWTLADREGRLEEKPKWIKAQLFPFGDVRVLRHLETLANLGFIVRYEVEGKGYIWIPKFKKHQHCHKDEKASEIPPYSGPETGEKQGVAGRVTSEVPASYAPKKTRTTLEPPKYAADTTYIDKDNTGPISPDLDSTRTGEPPGKHDGTTATAPGENALNPVACSLVIRNPLKSPLKKAEEKKSPPNPRAVAVIEHLNACLAKAGIAMEFQPNTSGNQEHANARLEQGYAEKDLKLLCEHKIAIWGEDAGMREHLNPETLFGRKTKIEKYVQAAKDWDARGRPDRGATNGKTMQERYNELLGRTDAGGSDFSGVRHVAGNPPQLET